MITVTHWAYDEEGGPHHRMLEVKKFYTRREVEAYLILEMNLRKAFGEKVKVREFKNKYRTKKKFRMDYSSERKGDYSGVYVSTPFAM